MTGCISTPGGGGGGDRNKPVRKGVNPGILSGLLGGGKKKDKPDQEKGKPEEENSDPVPVDLPIGNVQMVQAEDRYVLIRSSRAMQMEPGTELMTYSLNGRPTAKLKLSPEKKGMFVVADIVQGQPAQGDRVVAMGFKNPRTGGLLSRPGFGGRGSGDEVQVLE
ncbi:MAG: hypothetical protein HKN23_12030 [Verrucomicrobiales bacterium]|nr:hypothetical protein [Verrucomicrobiales bacterium]